MNVRIALAAIAAATTLTAMSGCAVMRGQESTGEYVDDTAITTAVKAKFVDDRRVDASAIKVDTMKGTVLLSGFAKSADEKVRAEQIARDVRGVKSVKNAIEIRAGR